VARAARSKLEEQLDIALKELYPNDSILHDYPIKIGLKTLYVDRVICRRKLAFEVDGKQHSEFNTFHHKDAEGFASHKDRDRAKEEWLDKQGYCTVRLEYKDKLDADSIRIKILEQLCTT
jgi:very-short-patch-repair endonuclease